MEIFFASTIYFLSDDSEINDSVYEKLKTFINKRINGTNIAYVNIFTSFDKMAIKLCAEYSQYNPFFKLTLIRPTLDSLLHPENDPNSYIYKYADRVIFGNIKNNNDFNEMFNVHRFFIDCSDLIICYANKNKAAKAALEYAKQQGKTIINLFEPNIQK